MDVPTYCEMCGSKVRPGDVFCGKCGHSLVDGGPSQLDCEKSAPVVSASDAPKRKESLKKGKRGPVVIVAVAIVVALIALGSVAAFAYSQNKSQTGSAGEPQGQTEANENQGSTNAAEGQLSGGNANGQIVAGSTDDPPYVTLTGRFQYRSIDEQLAALPDECFESNGTGWSGSSRETITDNLKGSFKGARFCVLEFDSPVQTTISNRTENTGTGTDGTKQRSIYCCKLPSDYQDPSGKTVAVSPGQTVTVQCQLYSYAASYGIAFDWTWATNVAITAVDGVPV